MVQVLLGEFVERRNQIRRLLGQAVKTSPFHGGNTGSIPVGVIVLSTRVYFIHADVAQFVLIAR